MNIANTSRYFTKDHRYRQYKYRRQHYFTAALEAVRSSSRRPPNSLGYINACNPSGAKSTTAKASTYSDNPTTRHRLHKMKILEAQNAVLSNYEVYEFLVERQERLSKQKQHRRRGPGNLETLIHEVRKAALGDGKKGGGRRIWKEMTR